MDAISIIQTVGLVVIIIELKWKKQSIVFYSPWCWADVLQDIIWHWLGYQVIIAVKQRWGLQEFRAGRQADSCQGGQAPSSKRGQVISWQAW